MNSHIEELEIKLQEKQPISKLFKNPCLSNSENYHLFDGICIYFETQEFDYESAQRNCATKFSSGGKIFEPLTKSMNDRVYGEFEQITGTMALPVVEFSRQGYKIRQFLAKN